MSKPFSARCRDLAAIGLAAATLSGCELVGLLTGADKASDGDGLEAALTDKQRDAAQLLPASEPGLTRHQWRAADAAARRATGNLTASLENLRSGPLVLAFANGVTVRLESMGKSSADARIAPGATSFGEALGASAEAVVSLYRVLKEDVERVAPEGGLCRREPTTYVAIVEYVDGSGDWTFRTASFAGEEPGPAAVADPRLCGVFAYSLAP